MKYMLKTVKNENGAIVFDKKKEGKGYVYLVKSEEGQTGVVGKDWILRNRADILNLGVSVDEKLYPVKVEDRAECDVCGGKHKVSNMFPVYIAGKNNRAEKTNRMICKGCLEEYEDKGFVQCGDCKKVFDSYKTGSKGYDSTSHDFGIYHSANTDFGGVDYLCTECESKKYSVCKGCENPYFGYCIIKTKDFSAKYPCHKSCVSMVKEAEAAKQEVV